MLNLDAINDIAEDIEKSSKGGSAFLQQKELPEEADFRLLEPRPNMGGLFFVKERSCWINKKRYILPDTFGEKCPMQEILNEALAKNDGDLTQLVKRMCYQGDLDKLISIQYHVPMLRMALDSKGNILDTPDSTPLTLQCTTMLISRLLKLVAHRNYRGEKDGKEYYITDRVLGHNITLSKKSKGNRTEYDAIAGKAIEIAEDFYAIEKLPNPVYSIKKQMYSDEYLVSVINNYLYGKPLMEEDKRYTEKELEEFKTDAAAEKPAAKKATTTKRVDTKATTKADPVVETPAAKEEPKVEASEVVEEPVVEEAKVETPVASTEESTNNEGSGERSIEDDIDDLD